jgi:hypothetical protein
VFSFLLASSLEFYLVFVTFVARDLNLLYGGEGLFLTLSVFFFCSTLKDSKKLTMSGSSKSYYHFRLKKS